MAEEKKLPEPKQLRTVFVGDSELPIHFVNAVNVRAGLEEFYFTLGTTHGMRNELTASEQHKE
jgi:hypothetical protein